MNIVELDLGRYCASRMERYKIPKLILPGKEMPRNPYGKILKAKLKEIFRQNMENRPSTPWRRLTEIY